MDGTTKARPKPPLSFWQVWNMSFGFFGIQIGFGLQNANVSRIFQTLGAEIDQIPILWIAAPLTGLLVQPIIGHMSDKTWGRFGRRRPYFFIGAVLTTLALFIMPHSPYLWMAAGMLWIMDASINVTMEPFRAFVGDMLPDRQRTAGFAMQSFFIGAGAVFASALPWMMTNWLGVANSAAEGVVPDSVRYSFYVGAIFVLVAVLWTVFTTKEYSPEDLDAFEAAERGGAAAPVEKSAGKSAGAYMTLGGALFVLGGVATVILAQLSSGALGQAAEALKVNDLYIVSVGLGVFGLFLIAAGLIKQRGRAENAFSEIIDDMFSMPKTMRQLAIVQFFTWFALFAMWIYTTGGVAAFHYGVTDASSARFNEAGNWVGLLFAVYNGVAAIVAFFLIPIVARTIGRKATHAFNLALGGLGLVSFLFIRDPNLLWIGMIGVGFAWASIVSVPYSILSGALPTKKMGVYMGIFNFFIVIPQLLAASILGVIVRYAFDGAAIKALGVGGASLFLAAAATLAVDDKEKREA
ncbi:MAG: MFS transporter [Parvularculaceae bacterium]